MITFSRQPDGSYLRAGELPPRSTVVIDVPDSPGPTPAYKLEDALALLTRGPLRAAEYRVLAVNGTAAKRDRTEGTLAAGLGIRKARRIARSEARENPAPIDGHTAPEAQEFIPATEVQIQPEGETRMASNVTHEEANARAKKMREAFDEGATIKQLIARFQFSNAGAVGNVLTGRTCKTAGGPIVKSVRRPKPKAEKGEKGPAQPKARKAKARTPVAAPVA